MRTPCVMRGLWPLVLLHLLSATREFVLDTAIGAWPQCIQCSLSGRRIQCIYSTSDIHSLQLAPPATYRRTACRLPNNFGPIFAIVRCEKGYWIDAAYTWKFV